jgi:hypothetical protein
MCANCAGPAAAHCAPVGARGEQRRQYTPAGSEQRTTPDSPSRKQSSLKREETSALADAVSALEDLRTAVGVGVNLEEYSRRLIDSKIRVRHALARTGAQVPDGLRGTIDGALADYESALTVWSWKIENVRQHSKTYEYGYYWMGDEAEVIAWLNYCPQALQSRPTGVIIGVMQGTWFPDIVIKCYWGDAGSKLDKVKAQLAGF